MKADDFIGDIKALCWQYWKADCDVSDTMKTKHSNMRLSNRIVITFINKDYE